MIEGLRPYPAYQESGVRSLGKVPGHWSVERIRNVAEMRVSNVDKLSQEDEIPVRLCNYTDVYKYDRIKNDMLFMRATATAAEVSQFRLEAGDVLLTKDSETWNDIGVPALVETSADDLVSGYHLALLRALRDRITGPYLLRALQAPGVAYHFHVAANGVTRYGLSHDSIKSVRVPVPPLDEQAPIVRFLDYVDRRIRRYIGAKQKLIRLLEEQKQGIILRVVTRGLDPNVNLKPSGVEWLGDVPEHWEVSALRHRYSQGLGKMLDSRRITGEYLVPYVRNTDVQWDHVNTFDLPMMDISPDEIERYTVRTGDLLVCEGGEVGRAAIWTNESGAIGFQKALHRLRPRSATQDEPRFLFYALRAASDSDAFNDGHVSTIAHLTGDKLRGHRFPFPPIDEQRAIVVALDQASTAIDSLVSRVQRGIRIAREYRTRLIADVVTGKLDVREADAWLPDGAEEPELLDEADAESDAEEADAVDLDDVPEEAEV